MLVNQIQLICSYELLNDLLLPFRHLRNGKVSALNSGGLTINYRD